MDKKPDLDDLDDCVCPRCVVFALYRWQQTILGPTFSEMLKAEVENCVHKID